ISYVGKSPDMAQNVTRQLASLFIQENLRVREETAEGTAAFIDAELEKMRKTLQEQEDKIRDFKQRYMGALPEQQASNLQLAGQMQAMMQANSDALNRAQQSKVYVESQIESAKQTTPASPNATQLYQLKAELAAAEQRYKPEHPDVVRLRSEV